MFTLHVCLHFVCLQISVAHGIHGIVYSAIKYQNVFPSNQNNTTQVQKENSINGANSKTEMKKVFSMVHQKPNILTKGGHKNLTMVRMTTTNKNLPPKNPSSKIIFQMPPTNKIALPPNNSTKITTASSKALPKLVPISNTNIQVSTSAPTVGKKHALKKYDQFTPNTSCFWVKHIIEL